MKKIKLSFKLTTIAILFCLGFSFAGMSHAWNDPLLPLSINSNTDRPIDTSNTFQAKGILGVGVAPASLLQVVGMVTTTWLNVMGNAFVQNDIKIASLNSSNNPGVTYPAHVCADSNGMFYICSGSLPTKLLTIQKFGAGSGTVTSSPSGINCGSICNSTFNKNTSVQLTATASPGSVFAAWYGCNTSNGPQCDVTMDTDKTINVAFNIDTGPLAVTTTVPYNINATSALSGGTITSDGGGIIQTAGIQYGLTTAYGSSAGGYTGSNTYVSVMSGLTPNTTYHVRAYVISNSGTAYGLDKTFNTTVGLPQLTTTPATDITTTTAKTGGNITGNSGPPVTERGVAYSTSQNPTISGSHTSDGSGTGSFISNLSGLQPNTIYFIRAYATNSVGTAYGNQLSFITAVPASLPQLTTTSATNITTTTAKTGGNITSDGGAAVTARGVAYSTSQNPTISGSHTSDGSGTGSFISNLSGLTSGATYYVRAYATNSAGTAYGNQISFTTSSATYTLTVTKNGAGAETGVVSSTSPVGLINCGPGPCSAQTTGSVTLSAAAGSAAYEFDKWTGGTCSGTNPTCTFNMNQNRMVNAVFKVSSYVAPIITTDPATGITETTAVGHGNINPGSHTITERGFVWSYTSLTPQTFAPDHKVIVPGITSGAFTAEIPGLTSNSTVHYRTYAILSQPPLNPWGGGVYGDHWYGDTETFTTQGPACVAGGQVFVNPGSYIFNKSSITGTDCSVTVKVWGAGGGGGGGAKAHKEPWPSLGGDYMWPGGAGGGGGGGYTEKVFTLNQLNSTTNVVVGAGGVGGEPVDGNVGSSGGTGGASSFGSSPALISGGGAGGQYAYESNCSSPSGGSGPPGGAGGNTSGGNTNSFPGLPGGHGHGCFPDNWPQAWCGIPTGSTGWTGGTGAGGNGGSSGWGGGGSGGGLGGYGGWCTAGFDSIGHCLTSCNQYGDGLAGQTNSSSVSIGSGGGGGGSGYTDKVAHSPRSGNWGGTGRNGKVEITWQ